MIFNRTGGFCLGRLYNVKGRQGAEHSGTLSSVWSSSLRWRSAETRKTSVIKIGVILNLFQNLPLGSLSSFPSVAGAERSGICCCYQKGEKFNEKEKI